MPYILIGTLLTAIMTISAGLGYTYNLGYKSCSNYEELLKERAKAAALAKGLANLNEMMKVAEVEIQKGKENEQANIKIITELEQAKINLTSGTIIDGVWLRKLNTIR